MRGIHFLLFFVLFINVKAQKRVTIYFEANSSVVDEKEFKKLYDLLKIKDVRIQKVIGYCDLRSSEIYIDTLAKARASKISNLIKLINPQQEFEISYKGDNYNKNKTLELTRKVEVFFKIERAIITQKKDLTQFFNKAKVGDTLVLNQLYFFDRTADLLPESYQIQEALFDVMKKNAKLKIEIQGHICCTPGKDEEEIALKRCIAIYDYLVSKGISKKRLRYKSFDATKPIFHIPEKNEEEKKANRRVEILILDK